MLVLFDRLARLALPSDYLSSENSSVHQRLERRQTLLGLANSSRMPAAVPRFNLASSSTPWLPLPIPPFLALPPIVS